jgi:hypothetical protein
VRDVKRYNLVDLIHDGVLMMHRDPHGIWCVPAFDKGFEINVVNEYENDYVCRTCDRRWPLA